MTVLTFLVQKSTINLWGVSICFLNRRQWRAQTFTQGGGGRSSIPWDKGVGGGLKFSSVWSKNGGGPPLDSPLGETLSLNLVLLIVLVLQFKGLSNADPSQSHSRPGGVCMSPEPTKRRQPRGFRVARVAQWWLIRVQITASTLYLGWFCCWLSLPCSERFFSGYSSFLLTNNSTHEHV